MALPKVAVVIPAFNAGLFIARTVLSAAAQRYGSLEILLVDDGSSDDTGAIAQDLAKQLANLRVIRTANNGVAAARNLGLSETDAEYVAFLDADDLWERSKIERQVAALAQHEGDSDWAASYSFVRYINEHDQVLANGHQWRERGDFFDRQLTLNPFECGSNLLVRRTAALEVGGFNPRYARNGIGGCEDLEFHLKILRRYKVEVVPEFLVGYRLHNQQMSRGLERMRLSEVAVVRDITGNYEMPARLRRAALSHAYFKAAKGALLLRNPAKSGKWLAACLRVSAISTVREVWWQAVHELAHIAHRAKRSLARQRGEMAWRPFADYAPTEGVSSQRRGLFSQRMPIEAVIQFRALEDALLRATRRNGDG